MYDLVMKEEEEKPAINIEALEWAMERKHWNAETLSKKSGVNKGSLSLLLKGGVQGIAAITVAKLATALEVSSDFLMGLTSGPEQKPIMDMAIAEIVAIAETLSEFRQRDVLLVAKAYREADDPTPEMLERIFEKVEEMAGQTVRDELAAAFAALHVPPRKPRKRPTSQEGNEEA